MRIESNLIVNSDKKLSSSIKFSDAKFLESAFERIYSEEKNLITEGPTINIELGSIDSGLKINSISTTYRFAEGVSLSSALSQYISSETLNDLYNSESETTNTTQKEDTFIITIKPDGTVTTDKESSNVNTEDTSSTINLSPSKVDYSNKTGLIFDTTKAKPSKEEIYKIVEEIAPKYNLDPSLVKAVIQTESSFNNQSISNKGAVGLMQLMPDTAREMGLVVNDSIDERWDPEKNIEAGIKYLAKCRSIIGERTGNYSWDFALAGYNAGPYGVAKKGYIVKSVQNYVDKVNKYWSQYK